MGFRYIDPLSKAVGGTITGHTYYANTATEATEIVNLATMSAAIAAGGLTDEQINKLASASKLANVRCVIVSGTVAEPPSGVPSAYDGVTIVAGDRILLNAQNNAAYNGLWVVAAGAWARPTDFSAGMSFNLRTAEDEVALDTPWVEVTSGSLYGGSKWYPAGWDASTNDHVLTVNTDFMTWARFDGCRAVRGLPSLGEPQIWVNSPIQAVATSSYDRWQGLQVLSAVAVTKEVPILCLLNAHSFGKGLKVNNKGQILFGWATNPNIVAGYDGYSGVLHGASDYDNTGHGVNILEHQSHTSSSTAAYAPTLKLRKKGKGQLTTTNVGEVVGVLKGTYYYNSGTELSDQNAGAVYFDVEGWTSGNRMGCRGGTVLQVNNSGSAGIAMVDFFRCSGKENINISYKSLGTTAAYLMQMSNGGGALSAGTAVSINYAADNSFVAASDLSAGNMAFGVIIASVGAGSAGWVAVGGLASAITTASASITRGHYAVMSDTQVGALSASATAVAGLTLGRFTKGVAAGNPAPACTVLIQPR